VSSWRDVPLIKYRLATCRELQLPALQRLTTDDPRFHEIRYSIALKAILEGRLDDADAELTRAYEFRPRWPAVTFAIADVALTGEDFARAEDFYARTLSLVPDDPEAAVGRARSLTYLARFEEAIAAADAVLALQRGYTGEALYWRAMAESELGRQDQAWDDVQRVEGLITNADVPKLAGIIESRRGERTIARQKLELAHERNANDCQTMFYLGSVVAEQRDWPRTVEVFGEDARCFEASERGLDEAIRRIDASSASAERKARLIARRRQQRASAAQDLVTCWFNLAAANFNLRRYAEARDNAGKAGDDPRYASRVRELLGLLPD
jgi:tetratricopeptide (TPR) repeat protein